MMSRRGHVMKKRILVPMMMILRMLVNGRSILSSTSSSASWIVPHQPLFPRCSAYRRWTSSSSSFTPSRPFPLPRCLIIRPSQPQRRRFHHDDLPDYVHEHHQLFLRPLQEKLDRILLRHQEQQQLPPTIPPSRHPRQQQSPPDVDDDEEEDMHQARYHDPVVEGMPPREREAWGVARHIHQRLQALTRNDDCPRCWLQRAHCICRSCPPLEKPKLLADPDLSRHYHQPDVSSIETAEAGEDLASVLGIHRLFLLMHHKEVGLAVDTAKLLLTAFPYSVRWIVVGLSSPPTDSPEEESDLLEFRQAVTGLSPLPCWVLFPSDQALTVAQWQEWRQQQPLSSPTHPAREERTGPELINVVVIDGTWEQARRIYRRYIPDEEPTRLDTKSSSTTARLQRIQLSQESLDQLVSLSSSDDESSSREPLTQGFTGRQMRRHPVAWREISTLAATKWLFQDMIGARKSANPDAGREESLGRAQEWVDRLAEYQMLADAAARRQLGAPRPRQR